MKYQIIGNGAPYGDNEVVCSVNSIKAAEKVAKKELYTGQFFELKDCKTGKVIVEWACDIKGKVYRRTIN